jgi:hypothetical protein
LHEQKRLPREASAKQMSDFIVTDYLEAVTQ